MTSESDIITLMYMTLPSHWMVVLYGKDTGGGFFFFWFWFFCVCVHVHTQAPICLSVCVCMCVLRCLFEKYSLQNIDNMYWNRSV